jgi:lipoprotein-anchoring transpeptidase ErfK/SrfK
MTELISDPSPTRSSRGKGFLLLLVVIVAVVLAFLGWMELAPKEPATPLAAVNALETAAVALPASPPAPTQPAPPPPVVATPAEAPVTAAVVQVPSPEAAPAPTTPDLAAADDARREGRLQEARELATSVLAQATDATLKAEAEKLLGQVNIALLLSPRPMPEKTDYTVQPGDSLDKIARKFGTTVELIQKSNNLRGALIKAGDRMRVFSGSWAIRVNKTRNDLLLTLNGTFFKRYRVGTGEYSKTPVGDFKLVDRIAQPTWWHPDGHTIPYGAPENLLGTHWLALDIKGYGIHGTWEPETIGKQASLGCVRLLNEEVEELFMLVTIGTPVAIEE